MQGKFFVDTNIWLYAFMESVSAKKQIAVDLVADYHAILSTQVINEICVNLIKKANYSDRLILLFLKNIHEKYYISTIHFSTLTLAAELRIKYEISFWDSLIVASALENNCKILYSEDMQHNQVIENSLSIINPFI